MNKITEKIPYFLVSGLFLVIALFGKQVQASNPLNNLLITFASIPLSISHIIYPVNLTIFYPFVDAIHLIHPRIVIGAILLIILIIIGWFSRKKTNSIIFSMLWFLFLIAPSLINTQKGGELGIPDIYLTSDRYVYLAILGPIFLIGLLLKKNRWSWGILPILILIPLSFFQIKTWQNSTVLFQRVLDVNQPSYVASLNLAGFAAQDGNLEKAEELYEYSLGIRRTTKVLYNLIQIKGSLDKKDEALLLYNEYKKLKPDDREGHAFLRGFAL